MGYATLRVINDDRLAPGGGFPTHGHRDMEIVTWILEGALEHKDSMSTRIRRCTPPALASAGGTHILGPGRVAYLHVARAALTLNGRSMQAGDGAKVRDEARLDSIGVDMAESLLFDMMQHRGAIS
ncbi:MAG: pirin family protein, partial [Thiobacillaceae bacterium]